MYLSINQSIFLLVFFCLPINVYTYIELLITGGLECSNGRALDIDLLGNVPFCTSLNKHSITNGRTSLLFQGHSIIYSPPPLPCFKLKGEYARKGGDI